MLVTCPKTFRQRSLYFGGADILITEELISVVIPVYNRQNYISDCIKSVLDSTYPNIEIIIVNDGSTDRSLSICKYYAKKDRRIRIISQKNSGPSKARNVGTRAAKGKYIAYVDSDDTVHKELYSVLYENIKRYDSDIATIGMVKKYKNGREEKLCKLKDILVFDRDRAMNAFFDNKIITFSLCDKLFKKDILPDNLLDESIKMCEDQKFVFETLLKSKKIVSVPEYMYYIRMTEGSLSRTKPKKYHLSMIDVDEYIISKVKDNNRLYSKAKLHLYNLCISYFAPSFNNGNFDRNDIDRVDRIIKEGMQAVKQNGCKNLKIKFYLYNMNPKLLSLVYEIRNRIRNKSLVIKE